MSVIIRLQNLPWSANALDIRSFFRGLSIPDGGVHIVGGELGDAFIAFSTDEDARQAMLLDRGKINETQIRLLLSSRTEMQKVIETARQSSLSMMQITQKQPQPVQQTEQQPVKPNQVLQQPQPQQQQQQQRQQKRQTSPLQPPQPPVITSTALKNILSQPTQHNFELNESSRNSYQSYNQKPLNENSLEAKAEGRDNKVSRDEQAKPNISERSREKDRVRDRDRDRYKSSRSRSRDRGGNRRRRERSRSRSRDRRDRRRHSRSRDRSRERNRNDRTDVRSRRERDARDSRESRDPRESRESKETRELREQREQREQREEKEQRDPKNQLESRDPRERTAKDREKVDNNETEDIPMIIANDDDDDNKEIGFMQQKSSNVNVWSVPPPTPTNPSSYMQGYNFFEQSQIPSYQTNTSQMRNFNQMGNPPQLPQQLPQSQQLQQQRVQQNLNPLQYSQSQQLQYPKKTHQQQQQEYEQFQQQIQQSSQGDSRNSPEKNQVDNRENPQKSQKQEDEPLNFQSYFNSNLMSTFNYFGSNSKSTPFQNPYTMAFKENKNQAPPSLKDENRSNTGNNFSGIFGNSSRKEEFEQKNTGGKDQPVNKDFDNKPLPANLGKEPSKTPEIPKPMEINYDEIQGNCIKISNMCQSTNYSDLRRFFSGLYIANNGIKMVNDKHGLRIGISYVRFVRPESKRKAFIRNGLALKSKRVIIESCTEDEFDQVVDSFKPARTGSGYDHQYDRNIQVQQKDEPDKTIKSAFSSNVEKEDSGFSTLLLEDLPAFAQEQDILKMFAPFSLIDIILTKNEDNRKQYICYVRFRRPEDAKIALQDTSRHLIGHKQIFVSRCSKEDFEKGKEKFNLDKEMGEELEDNSISNDELSAYDPFIKDFDDNTKEDSKISENNENNQEDEQESPQIPSLLSLPPLTSDPRRRGQQQRQTNRFNRPDEVQIKTTFVLIKNCDYRSTKHDFSEFFAQEGIKVERVEILFNNRNQPSGECIVEFNSEEDAEKSLAKTNSQCGSRNVRLELISPEAVANRLGEDFFKQSNTRNDSYPSFPPFNGNSNDNVNFSPGLQDKLLNLICNNFGNNSNSGISNISQEIPIGNQNMLRSNTNNPPRGGGVGGGGRGGDDMRGGSGGRRGQRKSRFSDFKDNKRFGGNSNSGSMQPNIPPPQNLNNASVDQFGQPGCVVSMENVPYKAGIEDILDFFRKFNVQPQNVIRRYNDDGTPTGDARVAFTSPMEARTAIESKRNQKIFNRTIFLALV